MENLNILKGTINITSSIEVVYSYPVGIQNKIISLDEEDIIQIDDQNIIGGSCLLPPMLAKIAESDGDAYNYEMIYKEHLVEPYQQQFIAALIAALYRGKNLLIFLPELGYTFTRDSFCLYMFQLYGIQIGLLEMENGNMIQRVPCFYQLESCPIWLNLIYEARVINGYEYLINYPIDADIRANEKVMYMLISELRPYANTINKRMDMIVDLHKKLHENPNIRMPIHQMVYLD